MDFQLWSDPDAKDRISIKSQILMLGARSEDPGGDFRVGCDRSPGAPGMLGKCCGLSMPSDG